jgi:exodeoxyribonuclease VII small subunit
MADKSRKITFEDGLAKLESIVAEMEEGKMGLDKMLKKFSEGMKLAKFCSERLESAEKKVEILVKKQDGSKSTEPFRSAELNADDQ